MVELLCDTGNGTDALLARFTREEFEALFAGHVKVLHALRERNPCGQQAGCRSISCCLQPPLPATAL